MASPAIAAAPARASETYGRLPLHFEANRGQTHEDVRFLTRGTGYDLYLTASEAVLVLARHNTDEKPAGHATSLVVRMSLVNAAPAPPVSGLEELPGKANYFIGNDPASWRSNIPTYAKVQYREVYPGIDLIYYGKQRQLEYDFVVAPGADPQCIELGFEGAERLEIDVQGELVLHVADGVIRQRQPVIYQERDGTRRELAGGYVLKRANRVGFRVAAYDRGRPLIIDPVLSYATYLGGSGDDVAGAVAVDKDGHLYVTGHTSSTNFPITAGVLQPVATGSMEVFVAKLNPSGSGLVYSAYLGGSGGDQGSGIAVDALGNTYVAGTSSSNNFPIANAFRAIHAGNSEAFVTKLNPAGSRLIYSTYLGGSGDELGNGIAVDALGSAFIAGYTVSVDFPTSPGTLQGRLGGGSDAFVTQLNPAGSELVFSTYLGGSGYDTGSGIALDTAGNAYLTGHTNSPNFPTTAGAAQSAHAGGYYDAFVTKLNSTGSALTYSTYLGGASDDEALKIAVDVLGHACITGQTGSSNFPTTPAAFQGVFAGGTSDAFVTKLTPDGSGFVYSTYLGGSGSYPGAYNEDRGLGIAADAAGNAYVTGITTSPNFPTASTFQRAFGGDADIFVTKLSPAGSAIYSSYLGGSGLESGSAIAVDALGNGYVTGYTNSLDFPTTPGALQSAFAGGSGGPGGSWDAIAVKIVEVVLQSSK